jgi:excinuclease ABC subunit C
VQGEPEGDVLSAFIVRYYLAQQELGRELLIPGEFSDRALVESHLCERTGRTHKVRVPRRGIKRDLVLRAEQNARHLLEEHRMLEGQAGKRAPPALYALRSQLNLERVPRSIIGFDISNIQGTDPVGAAVWFENGRPLKGEYRRFKIESVQGVDDNAAMQEVVSRYFTRRLEEERELPHLVLVDGGKGQLSAAAQALERAGVPDLPLVSLAKREEAVFTLDRTEPLRLERREPCLRLLQQVRDEAHRFGVEYHRLRRGRRTLRSELLDIPGIGPARLNALIQQFGSVRAIKAAKAEQIAAVRGIGAGLAAEILRKLNTGSADE